MDYRIIDVTLRDGGYRNNFAFSPTTARTLVQRLCRAGIESIEVGYQNGSPLSSEHAGLTARVSSSYLADLRHAAPRAHLAVVVHPERVEAPDMLALAEHGVDLVRICTGVRSTAQTRLLVRAAQAVGLEVGITLMRVASMATAEVRQAARLWDAHGVDLLCLADTDGAMVPQQVTHLFESLPQIRTQLGFHARDDLWLALVNAVAALQSGATTLDASLGGMGKGAGNLALENLVTTLFAEGVSDQYDLLCLMDTVEYAAAHVHNFSEQPARNDPNLSRAAH